MPDLVTIIQTAGYLGVFAIVFAESGLFFGFFLPGDSLLFTAGFLASQGFFNIAILATGCFIAAVVGDSVGYWMGRKYGKKFFSKEDSLFFHKDHLVRANTFYKKHGGKTIIIARFMPFIRSFAPIVAGIGDMTYSSFIFFNIIGGLLWAVGLTTIGFFLGSAIPDIDKYLFPIIGLIVIVSISPAIYHALTNKETRGKIITEIKKLMTKKK